MHINANQMDHLARADTLTVKTPFTQSGSNSSAEGMDLMPFIGVGTFWVAALLQSTPYTHDVTNSHRVDSLP